MIRNALITTNSAQPSYILNPSESEPNDAIEHLITHFEKPCIAGTNISQIPLSNEQDSDGLREHEKVCANYVAKIVESDDVELLYGLLSVLDWRLVYYLQGLLVSKQFNNHQLAYSDVDKIASLVLKHTDKDYIDFSDAFINGTESIDGSLTSYVFWHNLRIATIRKLETFQMSEADTVALKIGPGLPDLNTALFEHSNIPKLNRRFLPSHFDRLLNLLVSQASSIQGVKRLDISKMNLVKSLHFDDTVIRFLITQVLTKDPGDGRLYLTTDNTMVYGKREGLLFVDLVRHHLFKYGYTNPEWLVNTASVAQLSILGYEKAFDLLYERR